MLLILLLHTKFIIHSLGNTTIAIQQSMYEIEMKTSLRYLPRTNENDYFLIQQNLQ